MKVQLYSGGMDSYIISHLWKPDVKLYIDYGDKQNEYEKSVLPSDVIIKNLELSEYTQEDGIKTIPLRNLIFAAIAINYGDEILIGGLKSDLHYDKKPEFAEKATNLFNSVLEKERKKKSVRIVVPFCEYTKTDLVVKFLESGGTIDELNNNSWSCHNPINNAPCGICQACIAKQKAITEALVIYKKGN